jgi:alpha-tubulin suppressor-like RCC1 family protein
MMCLACTAISGCRTDAGSKNDKTAPSGSPGGPPTTTPFALATAPARGAKALFTGEKHACAVLVDGSVRCWGENLGGELGDGTRLDRTAPVTVKGIDQPSELVLGSHFSCALVKGAVSCWGDGAKFDTKLEIDEKAPVDPPRPIAIQDVTHIAGGTNHICALLASGGVQCWGSNDHGQLGTGTRQASSKPVPVKGLDSISAISANYESTCAIDGHGAVYCWGHPPGDDGSPSYLEPRKIEGLGAARQVANGAAHFCAIAGNGLSCWGWNSDGQLGDKTTADRKIPGPAALDGVSAIALGFSATCAIARSES